MSSSRTLSDVAEEPAGSNSPAAEARASPYLNAGPATTGSTSTFNATGANGTTQSPRPQQVVAKKPSQPSSLRTVRSSKDIKRNGSPSGSVVTSPTTKDTGSRTPKTNGVRPATSTQRIRNTPRLAHDYEIESAATTIMYWSRAPVYGAIPMRSMRAHSVTLVDSVAWLFGGCDDKGCWKDIYCFDTETMQWSHPETQGDIPPPCRAHTATLVDNRRLVIFGGGQGPTYYNDTWILDTTTRRWAHPTFSHSIPASRRAHTAVLYKQKLWVFGGGNGMQALNDLWCLDVGCVFERMKWEEVETRGRKPQARGYHTANIVGNVMVVVGGSDGKECFSDIWCLNLDTLVWSTVKLQTQHRRLSHSATQVGSYLFIMGGHDGTNYTSDLLLFNLVSLQYEPRPSAGKPPSPRGYHVTLLADSRLFVFGGFNGHDVFDDVFILDLAGAAYLPQVTSFSIDV